MSIYFIDIKATSVSERKCFLPFHAGRNPGGNQGGRGAGSRSRRIVEVSLLPVLRLPDLLCGGKDNWRSPRGMACCPPKGGISWARCCTALMSINWLGQ